MINIFFDAHTEILQAFNKYEVEYLMIGGYAVIYHGYNRTTGDMDIWLKPTIDNQKKVCDALVYCGFDAASIDQLNQYDFREAVLFYFGVEPQKIEFMTRVALVDFEMAYTQRINVVLEDDFEIPMINLDDLILTKINTGRTKDKADIEELQRLQKYKKDNNT